jgi:hypothetical protein
MDHAHGHAHGLVRVDQHLDAAVDGTESDEPEQGDENEAQRSGSGLVLLDGSCGLVCGRHDDRLHLSYWAAR